jgi:ubiquinone/menaquinone biosynthesis C-methylase UbiE
LIQEKAMENAETIKGVVRGKYGDIARQGGGCCGPSTCCGPSGEAGIVSIGEDYSAVEGYVKDADLGLGCGIPTDVADLKPGQTVLDLGSGAGNDVFVARHLVGEAGKVIGVDMTPDMIQKARENAAKLGYANVEFRLGEIESLPVNGSSVDRILSNCVLNLVPDKRRAFAEMFRVLKPEGRFGISDVLFEGEFPEDLRKAAELYVGCISGAMRLSDYIEALGQAGFKDVTVARKRPIEFPEEWLATYLSDAQRESLRRSGVSILSVTVQGTKPGLDALKAQGACCLPLEGAGNGPCCG